MNTEKEQYERWLDHVSARRPNSFANKPTPSRNSTMPSTVNLPSAQLDCAASSGLAPIA